MTDLARFSRREMSGAAPSRDMRSAYEHDGFLLLEDFVSSSACAELVARIGEIAGVFDPVSGASVFSTRSHGYAKDLYFAGSGDKIRYFFEQDAFDASGALTREPLRALNKVGHALHDLDPVFMRFSRSPGFEQLVTALGTRDPLLVQSMYLFKQPEIGGEVRLHQDATFLMTEPHSVVGLWFALEDATVDNGCLFALRGGHCGGLRQRFVRTGDAMDFEVLDDTPWPEGDRVALEAPAGSLVVLHGLLPHGSAPNRSSRSRHAYSLHVVDGRCRWLPENWLRRPVSMPLAGFGAIG